MTSPPTPRPSVSASAFPDGPWKSVIRIFCIVVGIMGLALIGNEIVGSITCPDQLRELPCSHISLSAMFWGVALVVFALLTLQRGNVSTSLDQAVAAGSVIRGWFTRSGRATDVPGTTVDTVVTVPPPEKKP